MKFVPADSLVERSSLATVDAILQLVADVVHFAVELPEVHRLMTHEAYSLSPQLVFLMESFSGKSYSEFTALFERAQEEGYVIKAEPQQWYYAIVGMATVRFSVPVEYQYLSGKDLSSPGEIDRTVEFITQLILGRETQKSRAVTKK